MGQYVMVIRGCGQHHNNGNKADADQQLKRLVNELRLAGHTIESATILAGTEDVIVDAGAPTKPDGKHVPPPLPEKKA